MLLIDRYAYTNKLGAYRPELKIFIASIGLLFLRVFNMEFLYIINIGTMIFLTIVVAGIPTRFYMKVLKIPVVFLITSLLMVIISINNTSYIYSTNIGGISIGITWSSLKGGWKLFTTVVSSLTSIYFLILTTPMNHVIRGLKKIKLPHLIIELMILIYRSIFIFLEEANNIYLSQNIRFGYSNNKNSIKSISLLVSALFTRVLIRHKQMNITLQCKLYDGDFKVGD